MRDSGGGSWALRAQSACDGVLFAALINLLWLIFAAAGLVVLGTAPATIAAVVLIRRRLRGDVVRVWREFPAVWAAEFGRANLVLAPPMAVCALLAASTVAFARMGGAGAAGTVISALCFSFAFLLCSTLAPLYAHYELPLGRYLITTSRWLLGNLVHALLLAVAAAAIVIATFFVPGILPFFSVGAWLMLSTALCIGFFDANERRLSAAVPTISIPTHVHAKEQI
ncbi:YesL family protein [Microbacterium panaciterrae]|uniref:DUF624 domain-containing protein n=1 Tax=Microbacterium panaciterrae TaxID=985759 RepID=A0ABP8PK36_9MICO